MQKYLITAIICFASFHLYGQGATLVIPKLPLQANKIVYYDTVFLDTTDTRQQLFDNAHEWYRHTYETSDDRLTIDNTDASTISGTGTLNFKKHKTDYKDLLFTIDITTGAGYYVYKIYNLYGYDNGVKFDYSDVYNEELYPIPKPEWPKDVRSYKLYNLDLTVKEIIENLRAGILKKYRH